MSPANPRKRVAVVQLAYHPAGLFQRRSPREDPLFDPKHPADSLLPSHEPETGALREELRALRQRIREVHDEQLLLKVRAVLESCRAWRTDLVVFPEYSLPWNLLEDVAEAAGDMVVVAGTHTVDLPAHRSGVYQRLQAPAEPLTGQSVCPVLHRGRLLALQPKLNPARPEQGSMEPGQTWAPVMLPDGIPGPMGVLICLDFLYQRSPLHQQLVTPRLAECRFLAVPSLTPHYSLPEFSAQAWQEARRYKLPVLYCDGADGGGTSIYVDEGRPSDLRSFPDKVGYLEPGDEGVILAEVNLGEVRPGESTPMEARMDVVPVAEATLVYSAEPTGRAYARWLEENAPLLRSDTPGALAEVTERIRQQREMFLSAGALPGARARGRRLRRLVDAVDRELLTRMEDVRRFTRDVSLPAGALPPAALRAALARGSADAVVAWLERSEARAEGFAEVEVRLRKAAEALEHGRPLLAAAGSVLEALAMKVGRPAKQQASRQEPARLQQAAPASTPPQPQRAEEPRAPAGEPSRFASEQEVISASRDQRLSDVQERFVELDARVDGGEPIPVLAALDSWLGSEAELALLLGEFGSGRSTTLAEWARSRRQHGAHPMVLVTNLMGASPAKDAGALLLETAALEDTPAHRAELHRLVRERRLIPCFDGFDELATRTPASALPGRLSDLLALARGGGKVLIASRSHYFPPEVQLRTDVAEALSAPLGQVTRIQRLSLQALTRPQRQALARKVLGTSADEALSRIDQTPELQDLVHHPLLLGLVLETLGELGPGAKIGRADVYEAYLESWLSQSRPAGSTSARDEQTKVLAESLAESLADSLWHSGLPSCTWQNLRHSLVVRLADRHFESLPLSADLLGIQGGAFCLHEGGDRYRFAHGSFLEYFLARALVRALPERPLDALSTRPFTQEVASFLGELLRGREAPRAARAVRALQQFLTEGRARGNEATAPEGSALAAANAFRLLRGLARWSGNDAEWIPEGADLRQVVLTGEDCRNLPLVRARLDGALLANTDLSGTDLSGATLDNAILAGARLLGTKLAGARARKVDLTQAAAHQVDLEGADLRGATLRQSMWSRCHWTGAQLDEARLGEWGAVGGSPPAATSSIASMRLEPTLATGHAYMVHDVRWNPDGRRLASASSDGTVRLWDADTGRVLSVLSVPDLLLRSAAWHPDGRRLASISGSGNVRLWDADTGRELAVLPLSETPWSAAWHPAGRLLAIATAGDAVRLWDVDTRSELAVLGAKGETVLAVAWSQDGRRLASSGTDKIVRIWDVDTRSELTVLRGHEENVWGLAWHPDGRRLATASGDNTVRLWDADTAQEQAILTGHTSSVTRVAWHPEGQRLASASSDCTVRLWDVDTGLDLAVLRGHTWMGGGVSSVAWSPDGRRLASSGNDGTVRLWDAGALHEQTVFRKYSSQVFSLAWHPGGRHLVSTSLEPAVRLWDVDTGRGPTILCRQEKRVCHVAWHPEGGRLASASLDGTVRLWDVSTGRELAILRGHESGVDAVAWHPQGRRLASGSSDDTVRLWDADTGRELAVLSGHTSAVKAVAWHPGGRRLASASQDRSVRLWDADTGRELAVLRRNEHGWTPQFVAWHPTVHHLAAPLDRDNTVWLWDADRGCELGVLRGHEERVQDLAWHPRGHRLASASKDGTVRLWDVSTGRQLAVLRDHEKGVDAVAWHPGGRYLASGSHDGIRLWGERGSDQLVLLAHFAAAGDLSLVRTPGGFFHAPTDVREHIQLALPCSGAPAGTRRLLPLAGLGEILHRPDKVAAALKGDLSGDDATAELKKLHLGEARAQSGAAERQRPNPFRPGPALSGSSRLTGREAVIADLLALIESRSPTLLRGPRHAGKTSILHALEHRLRSTHQVRHVTLEAKTIVTDDDLAQAIEPELAGAPSPAATLRARLGRTPAPVLFLDEVANLLKANASAFAWLRAIGQESTSVVLVGSHWDWVQLAKHVSKAPGSSLLSDVTPINLGPLSEADALDFLEKTAPPDVPLPRDRAGRWVVERCGTWPFYLQVMGHAVVQAVRAGNRRVLDESGAMMELYETCLLVARTETYFHTRWAELPQQARAALWRVRASEETGLPPVRSLSPEDRSALRDTGLCDHLGRWVEDKPFYDWLHRIADEALGQALGSS